MQRASFERIGFQPLLRCYEKPKPRRRTDSGVPLRLPNIYRAARVRLAQDAFTFFDMASRAAALHGFRFRLVLG